MRMEDFVMLRRKREVFTDDDPLEPAPQPPAQPGGTKTRSGGVRAKKKVLPMETEMGDVRVEGVIAAGGKKKGSGEKWVRFLDVAITCPSDESDELSICKPSWSKKKAGGGQTSEH